MPAKNAYRQTDTITLVQSFEDTGYTHICVACGTEDSRYGGPIFGPRDIMIRKCAKHIKKKGPLDEDLERIEKLSWAVDPPPQKIIRNPKALDKCF